MRSQVLPPLAALLSLFLLNGCATGTSQSNRSATAPRMEKERAAEKEMIRVETPQPGAVIRSPLTVRGQAKGPWYFEGVFPLMLRNSGGKILARGVASAKGEWMTNDFVPFIGKLVFAALEEMSGGLILQKDNPSRRRELDDSLIIPVRFR